ncbi:hypothetical protein [Micromonospora terminaliae]|uniref:Uncharacterized protein n=1 Tax=Micromonospora terminaliae TaxID=1914461 RepID=A0AAJ3DI58_9ACTN|nr:hypothetical protein [Micromonospora terminaliae]NES27409.1 hypothetical protein [Micromonospora terminaliae]
MVGALGGRLIIGTAPDGGARVGLRVPEPGPARGEPVRPESAGQAVA